MEIRIKTAEEFHAQNVTIEIKADRAEINRLYTDEEVAAAQTSEAKLIAESRDKRIAELERELADSRDSAERLEDHLERSTTALIQTRKDREKAEFRVKLLTGKLSHADTERAEMRSTIQSLRTELEDMTVDRNAQRERADHTARDLRKSEAELGNVRRALDIQHERVGEMDLKFRRIRAVIERPMIIGHQGLNDIMEIIDGSTSADEDEGYDETGE